MKLKDILIVEVRQTIDQIRAERKLKDIVKAQVKKQQKNNGVSAFEAEIYTKFGGIAIIVYSFQRTAQDAYREIASLPNFKKFSKRPKKVKLQF